MPLCQEGNTPPTRVRECGLSSRSTKASILVIFYSRRGNKYWIVRSLLLIEKERERESTVACLVYVNIKTRKAEVRVARCARQSGRVTQEIEGRPERGGFTLLLFARFTP